MFTKIANNSIIRHDGIVFPNRYPTFELLDKEISKEMSTENIEVLDAWLSISPKVQAFGNMIVTCKFKEPVNLDDNNITYFYLLFNVHQPHQSPQLSNTANSLQLLDVITTADGIPCTVSKGIKNPFYRAFWLNEPDTNLCKEDLCVKNEIRQIQKISKERNFSELVKKYDDDFLKYWEDFDER